MLKAQRRVLFHARQPQSEAGDAAWPLQLTLRAEQPFIAYLTVIRLTQIACVHMGWNLGSCSA